MSIKAASKINLYFQIASRPFYTQKPSKFFACSGQYQVIFFLVYNLSTIEVAKFLTFSMKRSTTRKKTYIDLQGEPKSLA
jgi:hypothetical protein